RGRAPRPRPRSRPGRARGRTGVRRRSRAGCPSARRCAGWTCPSRVRGYTRPGDGRGVACARGYAGRHGARAHSSDDVRARNRAPGRGGGQGARRRRPARAAAGAARALATLAARGSRDADRVEPAGRGAPARARNRRAAGARVHRRRGGRAGLGDDGRAAGQARDGGVAALTPSRTAGHAAAGPLAAVIVVLAIAGAAPLVRRRSVWVAGLLPMAAGAAFALSAITTKLLTDAGSGAPAVAAAWLVATALASATGGIDELSALRTAGPATVAPLVLATQTLIPVALAPALFGETWPGSAGQRLGLAVAIAAVIGGAAVLGRARGYASVVEEA